MDRRSGELSLKYVIELVFDRRWLCLTIALAILAAGTLLAIFMPKVYRADALLAPNREVSTEFGGASMLGSLGSIASYAGFLGSGQSLTNEAIATMRSRAFLRRFIESQGMLPILYAKQWDPARRAWKAEVKKPPTLDRACEIFRDKILRIEEIRGEDLYKVSLEWRDPKLPAVWLDQLIRQLNQEMRTRQIHEASAVLAFLRDQVEDTDAVEVRAALFRFAESQLRRSAIANVRQDFAFRIIDPPFPSELDEFVRPRRVIMIALSILLGGVMALLVAVIFPRREAAK